MGGFALDYHNYFVKDLLTTKLLRLYFIENFEEHRMASRQAITRVKSIAVIFVFTISTFAGIWYYTQSVSKTNPASFSMEVISRPFNPMKGEKERPRVMAQQRVVFLVTVEENGNGNGHGEAVEISATVSGAVISVNNPTIKPGEVAEVIVIPNQTSTNKMLTITFYGDRSGFRQIETVDVELIDWDDDLREIAESMRDKFVPWLTVNHPEFGISGETQWTGTIVNPGILVVMHYMFYSEDWELYVTWHVTVQPYDWTRVYLRHRFTETRSTMAYEISSVKGEEEQHSIELPDWI